MKQTYVIRDGELVPKSEAAPLRRPFVISDNCDVISQADGKHYSSKSRYYADLRARGYEIVGNEKPTPPRREPDDRAIERVIESVMRGE